VVLSLGLGLFHVYVCILLSKNKKALLVVINERELLPRSFPDLER
jgi:hypothetical protein